MVAIKGECAKLTNVLATVCQATAASIGDLKAANGTFVAGDLDNLNDIGIAFISTHRDLDALAQNRSFLINTASCCRFLAGNDSFGNINDILKKSVLPCELDRKSVV